MSQTTPLSTYRLQINPTFQFDATAKIIPYLSALGISHIYASPIFGASTGSLHGYDVVDMNAINPELGGREGFDALQPLLTKNRIGWVQDLVPNHRAFDGNNSLLFDVLENGPGSRWYRYFDILWEHPYDNIRGRVLAPFLGDFFGSVLERGELRVAFTEQGLRVCYYDRWFPLRPESYPRILSLGLANLRRRIGHHREALVTFLGIIRFFDNVESERAADSSYDPAPKIKKLLWKLYSDNGLIREHVDAAIAIVNGNPAEPDSLETLHEILSQQHYRLSYWKVGTEELNYRRFFSINDLICVRVEDESVFEASHRLLTEMVNAGVWQGVRIDHLDGLYDPTRYVERLRERFPDLYVVVEKILEGDEELPSEWPIAGTTGYDFLIAANNLFYPTANVDRMEETYVTFTGREWNLPEIIEANKRNIVGKHMAGDIDNLALLLKEVANRYRFGMDLTLYSLRRALVEILTQFPIYRTYVTAEAFTERDAKVLSDVIASCQESTPGLRNELRLISQFVMELQSDEVRQAAAESGQNTWLDVVRRLQQYTSPVMAKGIEDTAFFIYGRAIGLNEVGGDPMHFGMSIDAFHAFGSRRRQTWPHAMSATATHDTKWGEDTRSRLAVLSELPDEWSAHVLRWQALNKPLKKMASKREFPSRNNEYLLYQALVGAAPLTGIETDNFQSRLREYAIKAAREAKMETGWLNPNGEYEEALLAFLDGLFDKEKSAEFQADLEPFLKRVASFGLLNGLSQTLLKLTFPGVPDVYQGTELWDFSLVDPDNRRPVDFEARTTILHSIENGLKNDPAALLAELSSDLADGRMKLHFLRAALHARRAHPQLFLDGEYTPIEVTGPLADRVIAFVRTFENEIAIIAAPRLLADQMKEFRLPFAADLWKGTSLHVPFAKGRKFRNALAPIKDLQGPTLQADELFAQAPGALLLISASRG